jgi:hypothetical protein
MSRGLCYPFFQRPVDSMALHLQAQRRRIKRRGSLLGYHNVSSALSTNHGLLNLTHHLGILRIRRAHTRKPFRLLGTQIAPLLDSCAARYGRRARKVPRPAVLGLSRMPTSSVLLRGIDKPAVRCLDIRDIKRPTTLPRNGVQSWSMTSSTPREMGSLLAAFSFEYTQSVPQVFITRFYSTPYTRYSHASLVSLSRCSSIYRCL